MDLVIGDDTELETESDNSDEQDIFEKIKKITGSSDIIHDNFNKRNKKVIDQKIDDRRKMNIKYERD